MNAQIDSPSLVFWAMMAFSGGGIVVIGILSFSAVMLFKKDPDKAMDLAKELVASGLYLRLGTLIVLVGTAFILALAGMLNEGVIAFLSGVAGFVLGGLQSDKSNKQ